MPSDSWGQLWAAIKAVWASKWNERAVLGLRKAGLDHGQLQMAVLLQAVLPAQHAFVAHTVHPTTGELGHRGCRWLSTCSLSCMRMMKLQPGPSTQPQVRTPIRLT